MTDHSRDRLLHLTRLRIAGLAAAGVVATGGLTAVVAASQGSAATSSGSSSTGSPTTGDDAARPAPRDDHHGFSGVTGSNAAPGNTDGTTSAS